MTHYTLPADLRGEIATSIESGGGVEDAATVYDLDQIARRAYTYQPGAEGGFYQSVSDEEWWQIVEAAEIPDTAAPGTVDLVGAFEAEIARDVAATPVGGESVTEYRGVRIVISGMSRVNTSLPQEAATIRLVDADGAVTDMSAATSWDQVYTAVTDIAEARDLDTDMLRHVAASLHRDALHTQARLDQVRARRNRAVRTLRARGVTAYRLAKDLDVAESSVADMTRKAV